jgi:hypothetical protein
VVKKDGLIVSCLIFFLMVCSLSFGLSSELSSGEARNYISDSGEKYALHSHHYCPEFNGIYWESNTGEANESVEENDRFYWKVKTYNDMGMNQGTYVLRDAKDTSPTDQNNNVLYRATGLETYDKNFPPEQPGDGFIYFPREVRTSCYQGLPNFVSYETSGFAKSDHILGAVEHYYRLSSKMYVLPNGDIKEESSTYIDGVGTFKGVGRTLHKTKSLPE